MKTSTPIPNMTPKKPRSGSKAQSPATPVNRASCDPRPPKSGCKACDPRPIKNGANSQSPLRSSSKGGK
jgi:hypothetical protein